MEYIESVFQLNPHFNYSSPLIAHLVEFGPLQGKKKIDHPNLNHTESHKPIALLKLQRKSKNSSTKRKQKRNQNYGSKPLNHTARLQSHDN